MLLCFLSRHCVVYGENFALSVVVMETFASLTKGNVKFCLTSQNEQFSYLRLVWSAFGYFGGFFGWIWIDGGWWDLF